ncbi:hypothetical protein WOLCODRAFT_73679 [Wolfiporia cocos MD-104 SS10]|uniref:Uncharacterized protein n=1 Tax=Wolfiporia cocos (strain MD-104) TaxID=742152 RepID=A0A2H3JM17_WOLCO|nr:hypothetical protein WOLCODRAFT_73679 [Wolfiporia cocos MD-104 SS10]
MWLYTDTTEGNCGLIGLVRSIRQEFSIWKILLVLFHPSWEPSQQENYICQRLMPLKWVDADVLVDEHGELHVTRAILAPAPPRVESRNQNPIEFDETQIWRAYPTCLGPQDVEVAVAFANLTPAFLECLEFSGQVTAVGADISKELVGRRY